MTHFTLSTIISNHNNSINATQNNQKNFHSKEFLTTQSTQHKTTGQAPTANNSTLAVERHRLGGSREKSAKNIEPVLHDQRLFTNLWSQKLYKIFYSVIRYLYQTFVSLKFFR